MEDKIKIEMEFPIHSSPQLLYQYISTPSGLSEWFADNVNSRGEMFTFIWNDSEETRNEENNSNLTPFHRRFQVRTATAELLN